MPWSKTAAELAACAMIVGWLETVREIAQHLQQIVG